MAEVEDGVDAESALQALDEEAVLAQHGEDRAEVPKVIRPGSAVDENVIKKYEYKPSEEGSQNVVHERLERG
jgi:hypothetical protein